MGSLTRQTSRDTESPQGTGSTTVGFHFHRMIVVRELSNQSSHGGDKTVKPNLIDDIF
jgi:hypothetical protein